MTFRSLVIALFILLFAAPAAHAQSSGLVAAYGFEEASGTAAVDSSGAGNTGTLAGPTRSSAGRFGSALSFNGTSARVNVNDSASLDLTTGMTLEAWVRPDSLNWRTVLLKERPGGLAYALYSSSDNNRPMGEIATAGTADARGTAALPTATWSHLATTYDGATLRLYVNGSQVASRAVGGALTISSGALRIGGNAVWGEYFAGLIDEVRVYNRALTAGEIQLDMGRAVVSADTTPPTFVIGAVGAPPDTSACHDRPVSDYLPLRVTFKDDRGPVTARLELDGETIKGPLTVESPLGGDWDFDFETVGLSNGPHVMRGIARDGAGNETVVECVWNVQNPEFTVPITSPTDGQTVSGTVTIRTEPRADDEPLADGPFGVEITGAPGAEAVAGDAHRREWTWDTTKVANGEYAITAEFRWSDYTAPRATSTIRVRVDNRLPRPTGLGATVDGDDVALSWDPVTGATSYDVYRDGEKLRTVTGTTTTDSDRPVGSYRYTVAAVGAGGTGDPSDEVTATVEPDTTPPSGSVGTCEGATVQDYVTLRPSWSDDRGPVTYELFLDGESVRGPETGGRTGAFYWDFETRDIPNGLHVMALALRDGAGNETTVPCEWDVHNPEVTIPITSHSDGEEISGNVEFTADVLGDGQPLNRSMLRVDWSLTPVGGGPGSSGTDTTRPFEFTFGTGMAPDGLYNLKVSATWLDYTGPLATNTIQVRIHNAPPAPTGVRTEVRGNAVDVMWDPIPGVYSYNVYRDGTKIGNTSGTGYTDADRPAGTYRYVVKAQRYQAESPPSEEVTATVVGDTTPPTVTLASNCNGATVHDYITLRPTWSDDRGPVTITIKVDGEILRGPGDWGASGSFMFDWETHGLSNGTHVMQAIARDGAGNESVATCNWNVHNPAVTLPFTSHSDGDTVRGTVVVKAQPLGDGQPLVRDTMVVRFSATGPASASDSGSVFDKEWTWDTTTVPDGLYTVSAAVTWMGYHRDFATSSIQLQVDNVDTEPPTAPELGATVEQGDDVHLSWTASTDNGAQGIAGYRLYRNGALYRSLPASARSFDDVDVAVGTHRYTIRAIDHSGNLGLDSNAETVTIAPDTESPTAPELTATVEDDGVHLSWTESTDDRSSFSYEIYRLGAVFGDRDTRITTSSRLDPRTYVDRTSLPTDTTYRYHVLVRDAAGNSANSDFVNVRIGEPDLEPPTAPVLTVTDGDLSWTAATDDHAIMEYSICVDGRVVQFHSPNTLRDEFLTLTPGTHTLKVKATDTAFKQSESNEVEVTVLPPDTQAPTAPQLTATVADGDDDVQLSWTESTDDRGVWAYRLYRNGALYRTITDGARSFEDVDVAVGTPRYTVRAVDSAGNQSPLSNEVSVTIGADTVPPTAPELTATVEADGVHLSWTAATDERSTFTYEVYRFYDRSERIAELGSDTREYVDTTDLPEATYRYRVLVRDAAGNFVNSNRVDVRIGEPDLEPPTAPVLTVVANGLSATLTWTASTDDRGLKEYAIYKNGQAVQFMPATGPREATFTEAAGTYTFKVQATDTAQKLGEFSNEVTVTLAAPTTRAPSISALTLAADNNDIRVQWGEAIGNAPISEYRLYRDGNLIKTTGPAEERRHWDVNMAPGTYRYRVVAVDTAGDTLTSGEAQETIAPDTSAPTAALTSACGTAQGTVDVTGTIGDDRGPLAWRLELDGQTIAGPFDVTEPTASFQRAWDTSGVANGGHQLRLVVRDGGGNETASAPCALDVQNATGLVAAYGFEQTSGTSLTDSSGKGSTGTLSGATWADGGKFGRALSFDGVNDFVTVPDSSALDLAPGMTLEAWVKPTRVDDWRTVLLKERPGQLVYALYATGDNSRPLAEVAAGSQRDARGTAALPIGVWTHLAATYDGSTLRLYVNGTEVAGTAISGTLQNSAGALKIGGNSVWGEYFSGLIDEVRVYERALGVAEIQADAGRPVVPVT